VAAGPHVAAPALVEGDDQAGVLPPDQARAQLADQAPQPGVGDPDPAGVHLMVKIRMTKTTVGSRPPARSAGKRLNGSTRSQRDGWSRIRAAWMNGSTASV
jgi:hypothetical protein